VRLVWDPEFNVVLGADEVAETETLEEEART
jgi:hypothetical protein